MQLRVLGPVEIQADDGRVLTLPRRQERCLLAVLLLEPGNVIPAGRLCALLWDDNPPEHCRQTLRTYVARVRAVLSRAGAQRSGISLTAKDGGYILDADAGLVDVHRFRRLLELAEQTTDPTGRDRLLREALDLWLGPPLDNAASGWLRQRLCAGLDELHWVRIH